MRLLLLWASTRLSFAAGADLSISIYRRTLYQSYAVHCARNSSEVINGISGKANGVIYSIIVPALTLISSSVMLIAVLIAMLAFGGFSLIYAFIIRLTRKQLLADSQRIARESSHVIKSLQEGLGGIRDVLIDGNQATYCHIYRNADFPLRRAQGNNLFISSSPSYGMEALGMMLIAALAYSLAQQADGIAKAIPILGARRAAFTARIAASLWIMDKYSRWPSLATRYTQTARPTLARLRLPASSRTAALQAQHKPQAACVPLLPANAYVLKHLNLIIAHRLTTLKNCIQIVELGEGGIKRVGTYQDIVNQTA